MDHPTFAFFISSTSTSSPFLTQNCSPCLFTFPEKIYFPRFFDVSPLMISKNFILFLASYFPSFSKKAEPSILNLTTKSAISRSVSTPYPQMLIFSLTQSIGKELLIFVARCVIHCRKTTNRTFSNAFTISNVTETSPDMP